MLGFFSYKAIIRLFPVLAGLLILAPHVACGGGGGGSASGGPDVSLTITNPAPIQASVMQGAAMPGQTINVYATGDLNALNGATIHVTILDPDSLFDPSGPSVQQSGPGTYYLQLPGQTLNKIGHLQGNIKIYVATDAAMKNQLINSPLTVPYDVTVHQALALSAQNLNLSASFGDPTSVQTITATLPDYLSSWTATLASAIPQNQANTWTPTVAALDGGTVQVTLYPVPAGSYTYDIKVVASATPPGQAPVSYEQHTTINYTVNPNNAVDYVIVPSPVITVSVPYGDTYETLCPFLVLPNTGVTPTLQGSFVYGDHPISADGIALASSWYYYNASTVMVFDGTSFLPAGTYQAVDHVGLSKNGTAFDVPVPITMTILQ